MFSCNSCRSVSTMIDALDGLIARLRATGVPVALSEKMDALQAWTRIDPTDRGATRDVLRATLVKSTEHAAVFDLLFDTYFALEPATAIEPAAAGSGLTGLSADELRTAIVDVLLDATTSVLRPLAAEAVRRYSGFVPGRPVGGTYYVIRTLRELDTDAVRSELAARHGEDTASFLGGEVDGRLRARLVESDLETLQQSVERAVREILVVDRGADALARTTARTLLEDVDLTHAGPAELVAIGAAAEVISRKLSGRMALLAGRRAGRRVDIRRTLRRSLATGGVPAELVTRRPQPRRPDLVVLADLSGSMAAFSRFALLLLQALAGQFHRVRCFGFVDGVVEVTDILRESADLAAAVSAIDALPDIRWFDGHSDYGHVFGVFADRWAGELAPTTTLLVIGDARANYHDPDVPAFARIAERVSAVHWLDPEPRDGWSTGDSVIEKYAVHCDLVAEVRTVRQLVEYVDVLA
jgi:uncharacterized protein